MVTSNDKSILTKDNWADNLLIKDQGGKLHPLKQSGPKKGDGSTLTPIPKKEEDKQRVVNTPSINTAPLDDSFAPIEYVGGRADSTAELVFHPDDKQQLDELAKVLPKDDSKKYSIDKIVNKIIEKQDLKLNEVNRQKFTDILYDFFRDRKSAIVVRELLYIKVSVDNKSLDKDIVDNILSIVKGIKNKLFSVGGLVVRQAAMVDTIVEPGGRIELEDGDGEDASAQEEVKKALKEMKSSFEPVPSQQPPIASKQVKTKVEIEPIVLPKQPKIEEKIETVKEVELIKEGEKKKGIVQVEKQVKPKPEVKPKNIPEVVEKSLEPLPKVFRPSALDKKQISDVVTKPKPTPEPTLKSVPQASPVQHELTGPVQELEALTLDNFRRFGDVVQDRVDKILDKINVLEKDSFTKKAQGIEAWRNSQVYKIYLELGQESMIQGKEVANLIEDYKSKDKSVLTIEEFTAISDLNKKLRF